MRLIDADALIKHLDDAIQDAKRKDEICDYWEDDRSNLLYYLDTAPTVDAVEVVRCKDCAFNGAWCDIQEIMWEEKGKPIEFCSYGERKDDETYR